MGSSSNWVKPKTIKLVYVASPLSIELVLRRKGKDWLAEIENQDNVSEWGDTSIHGLLFQ